MASVSDIPVIMKDICSKFETCSDGCPYKQDNFYLCDKEPEDRIWDIYYAYTGKKDHRTAIPVTEEEIMSLFCD